MPLLFAFRQGWRALAAIPLAAFALAACSGADDGIGSGDDEINSGDRTIPIDRLVEDEDIEGGQAVTADEVQAFLESKKSALATYEEDDRTAAELIVEESRAERISAVYMLVRLETESGIVSSGTLKNIKSATGCGCPDTAACDPKYANFGPQVRCAARLMRGYLTALDTKKVTVSGWKVGASKQTLDPCEVTPKNRATAALYTYNPWVGAYGIGCGSSKWGGASLIGKLFKSYRNAFPSLRDGAATEEPAEQGRPESESQSESQSEAPPACAKDGLYCGGNGVSGLPEDLYRCASGKITLVKKCDSGCIATPPGGDDLCRP